MDNTKNNPPFMTQNYLVHDLHAGVKELYHIWLFWKNFTTESRLHILHSSPTQWYKTVYKHFLHTWYILQKPERNLQPCRPSGLLRFHTVMFLILQQANNACYDNFIHHCFLKVQTQITSTYMHPACTLSLLLSQKPL